jgi:hypothetical protein
LFEHQPVLGDVPSRGQLHRELRRFEALQRDALRLGRRLFAEVQRRDELRIR